MATCKYCGRTFNEESVKVHENGCDKRDKTGSRLSAAASKAIGASEWKMAE